MMICCSVSAHRSLLPAGDCCSVYLMPRFWGQLRHQLSLMLTRHIQLLLNNRCFKTECAENSSKSI